jgi:hypothetical protein
LIDHFPLFARAIAHSDKSSGFEFIGRSSVPAFFAFFSSAGQLDLAQRFYEEVANVASPPLAVEIIQAFFQSVGPFRFLEHALDRFTRTFVLDCLCTSERTSLIEAHGATLIQCFIDALPLVPRQHLALLHHLRAKKGPKEGLTDLALCRFL